MRLPSNKNNVSRALRHQNGLDDKRLKALEIVYNSLQMNATNASAIDWFLDDNQGDICSWTGVDCNLGGDIVNLDLTGLNLTGYLPSDIGRLFPKLKRLGLGNNRLIGTLPQSLTELKDLQHLEVFRNKLTGPLPQDWTLLPTLKRILVQQNQFTGSLDSSLCSLDKLHGLDLFTTLLTGTLPACLGEKPSRLANMRIWNTQLTGTVPQLLCDGRPMNGFDDGRLYFGCEIIACPMYTYSSSQGRQTMDSTTECQPCPTAGYLASTSCPSLPSLSPTLTSAPSKSRSAPSPSTSHPTFSPSVLTTSSASGSVPSSNGSSTAIPLTRKPSSTSNAPSNRPTNSVPLEASPWFQPGTGNKDGYDIRSSNYSNIQSHNWGLLTAACVLSILAMATVVVARRLRRHWMHKQELEQEDLFMVVQPQNTTSDDNESVESDSGWNDTESSVYCQEDEEGDDAHDYDQDPWSVHLVESHASTTTSVYL